MPNPLLRNLLKDLINPIRSVGYKTARTFANGMFAYPTKINDPNLPKTRSKMRKSLMTINQATLAIKAWRKQSLNLYKSRLLRSRMLDSRKSETT